MKRKESNYRRYVLLCDEDLKTSPDKHSTQFGPQYLIHRRLKLRYNNEEYNAYLTYNTETDRFELFILYREYRLHKTSVVEGNFDIIMDHPAVVIGIAQDVLGGKENE